MYARNVKGQDLNFAVSGMLWRRSLVMIDDKTKTLWSHLLGKGMRGELEGTQLETLPGVITSWESWKKSHPDTTVLAMNRTADEFVKDFHERPGRFVLGLRSDTHSKAYPFEALMSTPVIHDRFEDEPIVILFDAEGTGGRAFSRKFGERVLHWEASDAELKDKETRSTWNLEGACLDGSLKGKQLQEIPTIPSFTRAWKQFYSESEIYRAPVE